MDERNASINELVVKYQTDLINVFFPIIEEKSNVYTWSKYIGDANSKMKRINRVEIKEHQAIIFGSTDYSQVNAIIANAIKIRINNAVVSKLLEYNTTKCKTVYTHDKVNNTVIHKEINNLDNLDLYSIFIDLQNISNLNLIDNIQSVKPIIITDPYICRMLCVNISRGSPYFDSVYMSSDIRIKNMIFVVLQYNDLDIIEGPKLTSLGNIILGDNVFIGDQVIPKFTIKNNVPVMACITIKQDIK